MLELLSPAGSPEAVVAAVQSGADAVYMGLGGFNARRGAKNFTEEEFAEAVKYCRIRGCKVYMTLNTLAADRELEEVARMGMFATELGVDAALVQDLGVARVLRSSCPDLPLHASTQMSVHNLAGVYAARELGMKRVVLARELSGEQIKFIAKHSPIEVEVFVHGALCVCHSGQCYMSALIGRRSGNRGACAQPCRMEYSLGRRSDNYPLSLKDNCLLDYVRQLEDWGVACAKIEGRMKRPEYTAIATSIYHDAIHRGIEPSEHDRELLTLAFSRDGFTDGYFTGAKENMGGVRGEPDRDMNRVFADIRRGYSSGEMRRVDVEFLFSARSGENAGLMVRDGQGNKVTVYGPQPERAQSAGLTEHSVSEQLYKTGGTPYKCANVSIRLDPGLFLPAAAINEMRRQALDKLSEKRAVPPRRRTGFLPALPAAHNTVRAPALNIQISRPEQLTPELAALKPSTVYVPLRIISSCKEALKPFADAGAEICSVLPRVICDTEMDQGGQMLAGAGTPTALAGNLGHIALARNAGMAVRGDFGLNTFNSSSIRTLAEAGLRSVTASFELRMAQVRDLAKDIDTELIVYGRLPCMVTDQCLIKKATGSCTCGDNSGVSLSDRMGSVFPVEMEFGCRSVIYNAHKLYLADKAEDLAQCGLWAGRLLFTTESPRECVMVMKSYLGESKYKPNGLTRGLYYRGVE